MNRLWATLGLLFSLNVQSAPVPLEPPQFTAEPAKPWLVMVTQAGCSYCIKLEREVLGPLRASGIFAEALRFTAVDIGENETVIDFDGQHIKAKAFAARYGAYGTPTLLYLGANGTPMADPTYGIPGAIEFYGYAIEERLKAMSAAPR